ncbi:zinc-ribbon domain-containing protein [Pelagibacteraceae bacterium]|nr:zinc-ribbon domain-containing protein [Pelagibacteraceae bacterium]
MIIQCKSCSRKFIVKDEDIPKNGRAVQCGYCSVMWHQMPVKKLKEKIKQKIEDTPVEIEIDEMVDESPSIDSIKASDGKTYRFLGSQWARVLPSGKTGLFARKKISRELDEVTGRKEKKINKKKQRKLEEVDPSSESLVDEKNLPEVYRSKDGLGFFGYIFLLIIIGFSFVGVLKTFEDDLLNHFPEMEYIFELFGEQLEFFAESVKNLIVIISDLINSY